MCANKATCPAADERGCWTACVVSDRRSEQGWSRLCNGVILFDDGFFLTPDGRYDAVSA